MTELLATPIPTGEDARRIRNRYLRPFKVAIAFSVLGEALLFVVYGLLVFPGGSLVTKLVWSVFYCGLGMGAVYGTCLAFFVLDRLDGVKAVIASIVISVLLLGVACDVLCLSLGMQFGYWGAAENPGLFIGGSVLLSLLNGAAAGGLCFTERGRRLLEQIGA